MLSAFKLDRGEIVSVIFKKFFLRLYVRVHDSVTSGNITRIITVTGSQSLTALDPVGT